MKARSKHMLSLTATTCQQGYHHAPGSGQGTAAASLVRLLVLQVQLLPLQAAKALMTMTMTKQTRGAVTTTTPINDRRG